MSLDIPTLRALTGAMLLPGRDGDGKPEECSLRLGEGGCAGLLTQHSPLHAQPSEGIRGAECGNMYWE
ncbi:hypothetical protein E2C01_087024 [Portunus trituberculatus]|uniref:Uncharacterized protein n=1 Tax=Portunus trituberculatus TaxID=210409 RepID=A0A5B7JG71_PORTR|nr:hypothetical protein [Portunus trituberculatus]